MSRNNPRPDWLTIRLPSGASGNAQPSVRGCLENLKLGTVCSSARCPNQAECFSKGRATFLLLGPNCTRRCGFCAVDREPPLPPDPTEPERVAQAVQQLKLRHAVITSVTRDDLPDGGAEHFVHTVKAVRRLNPKVSIEILVPDFGGNLEAWRISASCLPEVYNHNIETVERLYPQVRPQADYRRSIEQLRQVKEWFPQLTTKSGMMVGLGETFEEIVEAGRHLRAAGVGMMTVGQYLAPISGRNLPVLRYMPPKEFARLEAELKRLGFPLVAASPFVRSSYNAGEDYATAVPPRSE